MEFVKSLEQARNEEHAWEICTKLDARLTPAQKKIFLAKKLCYKAHKIRGKWHACVFKKD